MSDEIKEINQEKCFCKSVGFKKFLVVSLGTFVGGFCAISLFAALNKPPMHPMHPMMYHGPKMGHHYIMKHHRMKKHDCDCPCHKKMMKKHFENSIESQKKLEEKK